MTNLSNKLFAFPFKVNFLVRKMQHHANPLYQHSTLLDNTTDISLYVKPLRYNCFGWWFMAFDILYVTKWVDLIYTVILLLRKLKAKRTHQRPCTTFHHIFQIRFSIISWCLVITNSLGRLVPLYHIPIKAVPVGSQPLHAWRFK